MDVLKVRITEDMFSFSSDATGMVVDYYFCPFPYLYLRQFEMNLYGLHSCDMKTQNNTELLKSRQSMLFHTNISEQLYKASVGQLGHFCLPNLVETRTNSRKTITVSHTSPKELKEGMNRTGEKRTVTGKRQRQCFKRSLLE